MIFLFCVKIFDALKPVFYIALILIIFPLNVTGEATTSSLKLPGKALQTLLDKTISDEGIPGAVLGVRTPDGVWMGAAGKADLTTDRPMTVDTRVRLASITKQFTAVLIMKLIDEGLLFLDDNVEKWLPGVIKEGNKITIKMLLNHSSGIVNHEGNEEFWRQIAADPQANWTTSDVLSLVEEKELLFSPGTNWEYSNTGYYLLGMIAEKATGSTVEKEMNRRFFMPLEMNHTTVSRTGAKTAPFARDYSWFALEPFNKLIDTSGWNLSWDWTAGSAVSTVGDMLIWAESLFGGEVLKEASLRAMTTDTFTLTPQISYGYGLIVSTDKYGDRVFSHDGENPGVETNWLYYPDSQRTIFIAFNRSDFPFPEPVNASEIMSSTLDEVLDILENTRD
jgi:D-alanyl-D-alanine carboxypeptidase